MGVNIGRRWDLGALKGNGDNGFPSFLPKEVEKIRDPFARRLALRIERLPVEVSSFLEPIVAPFEG